MTKVNAWESYALLLALLRHLSRRVLLQKYFIEDFKRPSGAEKMWSSFYCYLKLFGRYIRPYDSFSWVNLFVFFRNYWIYIDRHDKKKAGICFVS